MFRNRLSFRCSVSVLRFSDGPDAGAHESYPLNRASFEGLGPQQKLPIFDAGMKFRYAEFGSFGSALPHRGLFEERDQVGALLGIGHAEAHHC